MFYLLLKIVTDLIQIKGQYPIISYLFIFKYKKRWQFLGNGLLQNIQSTKCLTTYSMKTYTLMRSCKLNESKQQWIIGNLSSLSTFDLISSIRNKWSSYYLHCSCKSNFHKFTAFKFQPLEYQQTPMMFV